MPTDSDRLSILAAVSAAWHEVDRVKRFLELRGYADAAACVAAEYGDWRRKELEAKERK